MPLYLVSRNDTRQRASFAECRGRTLGKINGSSRLLAGVGGLPSVEHYAKASLPSAFLCWVSDTKQKGHLPECLTLPSVQYSAKSLFAKCLSLPSAALGKLSLCRVPVILRSANIFVLGKERVSDSDIGLLSWRCTWWRSRTRVGVKFDRSARHCLGRQRAAFKLALTNTY